MRYNPPPTWPQPPAGWSPPPGWAPDPAWGPPPPGWALWVPDEQPSGGYAAPAQGGGYGAPGPGGPGSGGSGGKGALWAVIGVVVVLVLVGGGVGAYLLARGSDSGSTASPSAPATAGAGAGSATSSAGTASAPVPTGCANAAASSAEPAALGDGAVIGTLCVAVTEVVQDGTAAVLAEGSLNGPPENGRYMLIQLTVINQGQTEEDAFFSLFLTLTGPDGTEYEDTGCRAIVPDDLVTKDKVQPGGTVTGSLCLDVPTEPFDAPTLTISSLGGDGEKVFATR